ncbi:MAG: hypothetical protein JO250_06485 [Armatimonadetes bacterium]|nr:hypothetical protein [Armatimonadota bacterium]
MKHFPHSLAALGLAATTLAPATHAAAVSTDQYTLQSQGNISFTTPTNLVGTSNTLEFIFSPGTDFAPARITASNFVYSNDWSVDTNSLENSPSSYFKGHDGYTYDFSGVTSVTLYNNGTPSTITPVSILGWRCCINSGS